ncbi:MAG: nickel pincer cofactor biosynthesis protein LarC [Candidatus Coatesbacteria bacterium]|nr:MAG: nickel pincer cofactor biosynthesis protein LarC [Candidatus Coatesbacteria bacterium]
MKVLFIDGTAGVSGDMLLAAMLDLTAGRRWLEESLARLNLPGVRLVYPPRQRGGVEAIGLEVVVAAEAPHFDDLSEIEVLLARAELPSFVKEKAAGTFRRLAEAEQRAHRVAFGHVGFHEVGAADAVVDVVGTCILVDLLSPARIVVSPLRVGTGYVEAAHGRLPIPAPATAELLRGVPTFAGSVPGEFTTPTGAALIATFADEFGPMPTMTVTGTGYGPGAANPREFPNVLRTCLGEVAPPETPRREGRVVVLEANLDDMTPEELAFAAEALMEAGALDVAITAAVMKKGRPGHLLQAVVRPEDRDRLGDLVLRYTSTLGVRYYEARRKTLERRLVTAVTPYGSGKVKLAVGAGGDVTAHAEYDAAAKLAAQAGVPVREVARALEAAALEAASRPAKENGAAEEPAPDEPG